MKVMKVELTIPGRPVPKVRMTQRSKWTERAQKCLNYQERIAEEAMVARSNLPNKMFSGYLILTARLFFSDRRHGDLSNYIKCIEDGLQHGQLFDNDKQIRWYGEGTGIYYSSEERAEIIVEQREEAQAS